ncbi:uncharacterized protein LOC132561074 [Ylistrum balloti]|uniref:uncharacterized protein LOC132561074 n=1 Tax=Ylistrum balloti TaxID=509963 RepID=UPI002905E88E|nr:uncharacterized protein LOC132561074 [Ylistrum balloti]
MATCAVGIPNKGLRSRPEQPHYVIPAKRSIDKLLEEQHALTVQITNIQKDDDPCKPRTVTLQPPAHRHQKQRHVSFKEPLETVSIIAESDELDVTTTKREKFRHLSGDSGIGSITLDTCVEDSIASRLTSDVAHYPDNQRNLLTKAYTDMSSLTEKEKKRVLKILLVQVWKNEGFEEKAAYTCSCLIQREVDAEQDISFCRVVETSCSGLIQDSATLKDQFHQWEKFITFLHHLSSNMKSTELHNRLQCLVSHALNVTLALLKV